MKTNVGLKVKTGVKSGFLASNHNRRALTSRSAKSRVK